MGSRKTLFMVLGWLWEHPQHQSCLKTRWKDDTVASTFPPIFCSGAVRPKMRTQKCLPALEWLQERLWNCLVMGRWHFYACVGCLYGTVDETFMDVGIWQRSWEWFKKYVWMWHLFTLCKWGLGNQPHSMGYKREIPQSSRLVTHISLAVVNWAWPQYMLKPKVLPGNHKWGFPMETLLVPLLGKFQCSIYKHILIYYTEKFHHSMTQLWAWDSPRGVWVGCHPHRWLLVRGQRASQEQQMLRRGVHCPSECLGHAKKPNLW